MGVKYFGLMDVIYFREITKPIDFEFQKNEAENVGKNSYDVKSLMSVGY